MIQSEKLKEHAKRLRLYNIANRMDSILHHAQEEKPTYPEFLSLVLGTEVEMKERKDYERRLVAARLPRKHDLDEYDYNFYEGIEDGSDCYTDLKTNRTYQERPVVFSYGGHRVAAGGGDFP